MTDDNQGHQEDKGQGRNDDPFTPDQEHRIGEMVSAAVMKAMEGNKPAKVTAEKGEAVPGDSTTHLTLRQIEELQEQATRKAVAQLKDEQAREGTQKRLEDVEKEVKSHRPREGGRAYRALFGGSRT